MSRNQILKSTLITLIPLVCGGYWIYSTGSTQSIIVTALVTFVFFALTLPGVSASNVARGTVASIVASNVGTGASGKVFDTIMDAGKTEEENYDDGGPAPDDVQGDHRR